MGSSKAIVVTGKSATPQARRASLWRDAGRHLLRNHSAQIGMVVLGFLFIVVKCMSPNDTTSPPQLTASIPAVVTPALDNPAGMVSADTGYISAASLNGRAKPTTSSNVVQKLTRGESVRIVERKNGWLKVIQGAVTFWIIAKHVSSSPPEAQYSPAPIARLVSSPKKSSKRRSSRSSGGGCSCSSGGVCVGPRGGRYCYTSSGNKRYGI